ncbi:MAG: hypothetical protein EAY72_07975 [Bacteroidetes bacterium]|nr:MAG: hypothetical protein EAY72_07975 [Bacteroidota bacterium]
MKKLFVLCLVLAGVAKVQAQKTLYFIRHADKDTSQQAAGSAFMLASNPPLSAKGKLQANYWKQYFDSIPLQAAYTTNFDRTIKTVEPTALSKNITALLYNAKDAEHFAETIVEGAANHILVVGHSNSSPVLASFFAGIQPPLPAMPETVFNSLYIVHNYPAKPRLEIRTVALP